MDLLVKVLVAIAGTVTTGAGSAAASASTLSSIVGQEVPPTPTINIGKDVYGNDVIMPLIGAGTWQYNDTIAYESLCKAFDVGYTFIDTAWGYHNSVGVGNAINDCWITKLNHTRDELFVMTKIPGGLTTKAEILAYHYENLFQLQLNYVDHVMIHYPSDWNEEYASSTIRQNEWLILEELYNNGEARTIGISHYCKQHINDILEVASVMPSINQVEYHIGSQDIDNVIDYCNQLNITFMSFSPLCGPCSYDNKKEENLITGKLVTEIATHYQHNDDDGNTTTSTTSSQVTGNQISLRYIVQQNIPVIPKSNTIEHIKSNLNIFDFHLSNEDMNILKNATTPAAEDGDCDVP